MAVIVKKLSKKEVVSLREDLKVKNRMPVLLMGHLKEQGWKFDNYSITKRYKKYFLYIEFCIGDYCASIGSKKGGWLLEKKVRCDGFAQALAQSILYQNRIDAGEHWTGEED